jgi:HAD superfamily hydrolase (TIGR01662 family)
MKLSAVLLDMGGVLLDMGSASGLPYGRLDWRGREALLAYLRERGAHFSETDLDGRLFDPWREAYDRRQQSGREAPWRPHLRRLRKGTGIRSSDLTLLATWFRPYASQVKPLPGARRALEELREQGLRLGLVSNVPLPGVLYRRILERHRMAAAFDCLQFSYDAGSRKPSPGMLKMALSELGVRPSQAWMVGDRRAADVAAGRVAGVGTVWVRSDDGGGPEADHSIGGIAELAQLAAGRAA